MKKQYYFDQCILSLLSIKVQTGDKQYFELSVEVIVDRTGTTILLGISSKDSPDSPLHPSYSIHSGLVK